MIGGRASKALQYGVAIAFGILGGCTLWYWGAPTPSTLEDTTPPPAPNGTAPTSTALTWHPAARAYITALQEGRCEDVIDRTWWMQERLTYASSTSGEDAAVAERTRLCRLALLRTAEGNQLSNEGIEDAYLFAPGSEVELLGCDDGRDDLDKGVATRCWFRVTYPVAFRAPRDRDGNAIANMVIALNISEDGYIVKAGVRGDAEIDWEQIELREPNAPAQLR